MESLKGKVKGGRKRQKAAGRAGGNSQCHITVGFGVEYYKDTQIGRAHV